MFDYFNRPFDTFDWALIIGCGILFVGHFIWKIFFSDEGRRKIDNEIKQMAEKMLKSKGSPVDNIISKKIKDMEKEMKEKIDTFEDYKKKKSEIIARNVASYISTMSDTYAENMFCNFNASKDNYSL